MSITPQQLCTFWKTYGVCVGLSFLAPPSWKLLDPFFAQAHVPSSGEHMLTLTAAGFLLNGCMLIPSVVSRQEAHRVFKATLPAQIILNFMAHVLYPSEISLFGKATYAFGLAFNLGVIGYTS